MMARVTSKGLLLLLMMMIQMMTMIKMRPGARLMTALSC
jgi:hypothetical protein